MDALELVDLRSTDSTNSQGLIWALVLVKAGLKPGLEEANCCHCYADKIESIISLQK